MQNPPRRARIFRVERHPNGLRIWTLGLRCHHGAAGAAIATVGIVRRDLALTLLGCALMVHDWPDRWWLA